MATRQFAIPLDEGSQKSGDATFKRLDDAGTSANFELTNVAASTTANELNLITKKDGATKDHKFNVTVSNGTVRVTLTTGNLAAIFGDADDGDWDYVEARWTISGQVDTPSNSNLYIVQDGHTYNFYGW